MARGPRLTFAAPLVVVVGAGCGGGKSSEHPPDHRQPAWTILRQGEQCQAMPEVHCPPPSVATCNPPAPIPIACPAGDPPAVRIVEVAADRCVIDGSDRAVPCPRYDAPPPPPVDAAPVEVAPPDAAVAAAARRGWDVVRNGKTCAAMDDFCTRHQPPPGQPTPPCNPPAPIAIPCPEPDVVRIVEVSPGHCKTRYDFSCPPNATCNPPEPLDIDCPTR